MSRVSIDDPIPCVKIQKIKKKKLQIYKDLHPITPISGTFILLSLPSNATVEDELLLFFSIRLLKLINISVADAVEERRKNRKFFICVGAFG